MKKIIPIILVILVSLSLIGCSKKCVHDWEIKKTYIPKCEKPDPKVMHEFSYTKDEKAYVFGAMTIRERCKKCGRKDEATMYGKEVKE